jgi:hypothetical protein
MQLQVRPNESERATPVAGIAPVVMVAALAILALLGADVGVLSLAALLGLGSIVILTDPSINIESHAILT